MPRLAASMVLLPQLARFTREYPDVVLDVTTDSVPIDIVAARFDAGIEIGEFIQRDMIAVRVSPDQRAAIVASPAYWCPPFPGYFLYYPSRRHQAPGLSALIETLRNRD